jgi:hypothetical protein
MSSFLLLYHVEPLSFSDRAGKVPSHSFRCLSDQLHLPPHEEKTVCISFALHASAISYPLGAFLHFTSTSTVYSVPIFAHPRLPNLIASPALVLFPRNQHPSLVDGRHAGGAMSRALHSDSRTTVRNVDQSSTADGVWTVHPLLTGDSHLYTAFRVVNARANEALVSDCPASVPVSFFPDADGFHCAWLCFQTAYGHALRIPLVGVAGHPRLVLENLDERIVNFGDICLSTMHSQAGEPLFVPARPALVHRRIVSFRNRGSSPVIVECSSILPCNLNWIRIAISPAVSVVDAGACAEFEVSLQLGTDRSGHSRHDERFPIPFSCTLSFRIQNLVARQVARVFAGLSGKSLPGSDCSAMQVPSLSDSLNGEWPSTIGVSADKINIDNFRTVISDYFRAETIRRTILDEVSPSDSFDSIASTWFLAGQANTEIVVVASLNPRSATIRTARGNADLIPPTQQSSPLLIVQGRSMFGNSSGSDEVNLCQSQGNSPASTVHSPHLPPCVEQHQMQNLPIPDMIRCAEAFSSIPSASGLLPAARVSEYRADPMRSTALIHSETSSVRPRVLYFIASLDGTQTISDHVRRKVRVSPSRIEFSPQCCGCAASESFRIYNDSTDADDWMQFSISLSPTCVFRFSQLEGFVRPQGSAVILVSFRPNSSRQCCPQLSIDIRFALPTAPRREVPSVRQTNSEWLRILSGVTPSWAGT